MDFLDPVKQRAHRIRLLVGYVLLAIAVALATAVLLYQAQGFGYKAGKVIKNGYVYVQSMPGSASIDINGQRRGTTTARLEMEAGAYTMKLSRQGYRDWQRALTVEGGSVEHFTYPFLIPRDLVTKDIGGYEVTPALATQSPDRRWLLVQRPAPEAFGSFDQYDAKDPQRTQQLKSVVAIPTALLTLPEAEPRSLELVDWSNDNKHVLLRHVAGNQAEYIMFSRDKPAESVNLTKALQLAPEVTLSLQDKKYDRYFIHDPVAKTLSTASLAEPQSLPILTNVLAYKSYGSDTVLYVAAITGQTDKVQARIYQDRKQYVVRTMAAAPRYLLALSRYDNTWLLAAGSPAENRVYVYKDAVAALQADTSRALSPVTVLKVADPTVVAFSANSQLLMAQNGANFAVYDAEYDRTLTYRLDHPLDAPQTKAVWMDSHHLYYVSGGKVIMFDYDGTNLQTLATQSPVLSPLFDTGYTALYTIAKPAATDPAKPEAVTLAATSLRTVADQ